MLFGLEHGVEILKVKGKGPIIPFVVLEKNDEREVVRFLYDDPEAGIFEGIRLLKEERECRFAVLVHDGFLHAEGERFNAVLVKGFDRQDTFGYSLGQRYIPGKFWSSLKRIGKPAFVGNTEKLLA